MKKLFLLPIITFIFACTPEEVVPETTPATAGSMTCVLNGETVSATTFDNTLLRITTEEPSGKRLDLRGQFGEVQFILTCGTTSSSTGEDIALGTYASSNVAFEGLVTILEGWSILAMATGIDDDIVEIKLTAIDAVTKTCSGTFNFKARNLSTDEITYDVEAGVFTGLVYRVI